MFCEHPVALSVQRCISSLGQLTRTLNYPAASFLLNLQLATCFLFFLNILGRCPLCSTFLVTAGCRPTLHKEATLTLSFAIFVALPWHDVNCQSPRWQYYVRLISRDLRMSWSLLLSVTLSTISLY
jgi:F0F1-type ATP synthase membrane subunit a